MNTTLKNHLARITEAAAKIRESAERVRPPDMTLAKALISCDKVAHTLEQLATDLNGRAAPPA